MELAGPQKISGYFRIDFIAGSYCKNSLLNKRYILFNTKKARTNIARALCF
jgi:hypothetical protein